jgi:pimeloyl-ACP methyl ester carboxylesterase
MPTTDVAGTTVHYRTAGSGPGLVLVPGTGLSAEINYGHLVDAFTGDRTVVLADYAGGGETTDPGGELTLDLLAEQIAAVTAAASPDAPVDLVGFSLGAVVAAAVAGSRPELVRRLVLVAGWPDPEDARHQLMLDVWTGLESTDHAMLNRFLQLQCFSAPFLHGLGAEGLRQFVENGPPITPGMRRHLEVDRTADLRALLPRITAPTLVIGLTRDQVVPVERARALHEAIAGSQYAEIDSGHVVVFEQPAEFLGTVQKFLQAD